jgi:hypothetical protein
MARPEGETSNSPDIERLFATLVEWAEYLKDHAPFLNPPEQVRRGGIFAVIFNQPYLPFQMAVQ